MYEFLFEGVNAFKRIQMGDRDDDGAALYRAALGRVCVSLNVCRFSPAVCSCAVHECVTQWG